MILPKFIRLSNALLLARTVSFGLFVAGTAAAQQVSFNGTQIYSTGASWSTNITTADVNGDGNLDMLVVNANCGDPGCNAIAVFLGNGDGTFRPGTTYSTGGVQGTNVLAADMNSDGTLDLVVANFRSYSSSEVSVLIGKGDGTFAAPILSYFNSSTPTHIEAADLNGDGKMDIVVASLSIYSSGYYSGFTVMMGNGDGTFQSPRQFSSGSQWAATGLALTDVNGDGRLDAILMNSCGSACNILQSPASSVSVFWGNGDGNFQSPAIYSSGGEHASAVITSDLNHDGWPDLIVTNWCMSGTPVCDNGTSGTRGSLAALLNNGDGTFQEPVTYNPGGLYTTSPSFADINEDGIQDLVVTNECTCAVGGVRTDPNVSVLLGNADGTFQAPLSFNTGVGDTRSAIAKDVNKDGEPDLLISSYGPYVGVRLNTTIQTGTLVVNSNLAAASFTATGGPIPLTGSGTSTTLTVVVGTYKITFDAVPEYVTPDPITVNVAQGQTITVTLTYKPTIVIGSQRLTFSYVAGTVPKPQPIAISASAGMLHVDLLTATIPVGGSWLSLSQYSASTPTTVLVSPSSLLPAGNYSAQVIVFANDASNSPQVIPVSVNVTAAPALSPSTIKMGLPVIFLHGFCDSPTSFNAMASQISSYLVNTYPKLYQTSAELYTFFDGTQTHFEKSYDAGKPSDSVVKNVPPANRFFAVAMDDPGQTLISKFNAISISKYSIYYKADELARIIWQIKAVTGAPRVIVVAHSMGGLVARAYIEGLAQNRITHASDTYENDIAELITLDTPHGGAPIGELSTLKPIFGFCASGSSVNKSEMIPDDPISVVPTLNYKTENVVFNLPLGLEIFPVISYWYDSAGDDVLNSNEQNLAPNLNDWLRDSDSVIIPAFNQFNLNTPLPNWCPLLHLLTCTGSATQTIGLVEGLLKVPSAANPGVTLSPSNVSAAGKISAQVCAQTLSGAPAVWGIFEGDGYATVSPKVGTCTSVTWKTPGFHLVAVDSVKQTQYGVAAVR